MLIVHIYKFKDHNHEQSFDKKLSIHKNRKDMKKISQNWKTKQIPVVKKPYNFI